MNSRLFALMLAGALVVGACDGGSEGSTTPGTTSETGGAGGTGGGTGGAGAAMGGMGGTGGGTGGSSVCTVPLDAVYDGSMFDVEAAETMALRAQHGALTGAMAMAEADLMVKPTLAELTLLYEEGAPSVKSITTAYYDGKVMGWLGAFEAAAGNQWTPSSATPMGPGGQYGSYIFSATGTDLRQAVEKGLFDGAFYNYALGLQKAGMTLASLDRLLAAYGAHPTFPGDSAAMTNPDRLCAQYAERRSPKDPGDPSKPLDPSKPGPYFRIKAQLIRAQHAIKVGSECDAERDEAVQAILGEWERVMLSTAIFYLNDAALKLTKDGATVAELASGLHGYGEAMAFIHGFRGLPAEGRAITDAQIDDILMTIGAPHDAEATSYLLLTDGATEVPKLLSGISKIAAVYGWTAEDIESFKTAY